MLALLFVLATTVHAQVFEGPVSSALGGSGRAGLDANEGAYLNPALVPLLPQSEVGAYYKDGYADQGVHRNAWGVSISETGKDVLVPGMLSYVKLRDTGLTPQVTNGEIWQGAFGKLFYERFAIGISAYYITQKPEAQPMTGQWNGSIGAVYLITSDLGVALVHENPVAAPEDVPVPLRLINQNSFGVFYRSPYKARFRGDVVRPEDQNPDHRNNIHASIEVEFAEFVLFRVGGRWDEVHDRRFLAAGLSFNGPRLKLDYSFEKNLTRSSGAVHSVDLRTTF